MSERNRRTFELWDDALNEKKEWAESKISEATEQAEALQQMQDDLYKSQEVQTALQDEMFNSVADLWLSCWGAMEKYGLVNSGSILLLNDDNIKRANSTVNNIPYMDKNDILELLPNIFLSNPYNENLYIKLFGIFGDNEGCLEKIASYFGFSNIVKNLLAEERERKAKEEKRKLEEARREEERKAEEARKEEERKRKLLEDAFNKLLPDFCNSEASSKQALKNFTGQGVQIGFTQEQINNFLAEKVEQEQRFADASPRFSIIITVLALAGAFYSTGILRWISGFISSLFLFWVWMVTDNKKNAIKFLENWDHDDALENKPHVLQEKVEHSSNVQATLSSTTTQETQSHKSSLLIVLIVIGILALPFMLIKNESWVCQ